MEPTTAASAVEAAPDPAADLAWLRSRLKAVMQLEDWQVLSDADLVLAAESCFKKALLYTPRRPGRSGAPLAGVPVAEPWSPRRHP